MRDLRFLVLLLPGCMPVVPPAPTADLATPQAPAALEAPSAPSAPPASSDVAEDGLLAVPIVAEPAGKVLGRVIVSPGNPGEPGLWLRTSRTARTAQGTIVTVDGASADVVLIPADGVSQLSADGYAALGLSPGVFAEVTIYLR